MHTAKLLIAAVLLAFAAPALSQTNTLTFTVETSTSNGTSIVPKLTWATAPAATSCTASGASDWTGTKAMSGTVTLAAIGETRSYSMSCAWAGKPTIEVRWSAPTTFVSGAPLNPATDLGGWRIQYGRSASNLDQSFYLQDPVAVKWTTPATLATGTWFFTVRAYTPQGLESAQAVPIVSASTRAGDAQTRTLEVAVRFPNPPTNVTAE
jgi:hypothetical protein